VNQVNLSAVSGDMGVLANHVPTLEPLKAGLLEVIDGEGKSEKWFGKYYQILANTSNFIACYL
jgi:F-type H+-transporting ATPase subunit delta